VKLCCSYLENGLRRLDGDEWLIPADVQSHWAGFSPSRLVGTCASRIGLATSGLLMFVFLASGQDRGGRGLGIVDALIAGQAIARELGS
jgi:hypothetical protein